MNTVLRILSKPLFYSLFFLICSERSYSFSKSPEKILSEEREKNGIRLLNVNTIRD